MCTTSVKAVWKKQRLHTVQGNVSVYFLSVFLLVSTIISAFATLMQQRFAAILSLETAQKYQIAEMEVIQALKCALCTGAVSVSSSENTVYQMEISSGTAYVEITWPVRETMTVVYDEQSGKVFDFHAVRPDAEVQEDG
jgi:hypothetical protein